MPEDFPAIAADQAQKLARRLAEIESETGLPTRIVFAESCTSGLVASLLGQVPGISQFLCGSMVTYRQSTKQQWLNVAPETLDQFTAESIETSKSLALSVLKLTDEADFSAAVTGHLGPLSDDDASSEKDGQIYIVVAKRDNGSVMVLSEKTVQLQSTTRIDRQLESAAAVLNAMCDALNT